MSNEAITNEFLLTKQLFTLSLIGLSSLQYPSLRIHCVESNRNSKSSKSNRIDMDPAFI